MDGILLINKPENYTSYDIIKVVKNLFNTKKVGHCGTLDPFACGLLIVGINKATKIMSFLEHESKEYIATIRFGSFTDTYDLTGKEISSSNILVYNEDKIIEVLNLFKGEINQTPPIYSSIHVDGKHLYEYARNNEIVDIPTRKVNIYDIDLIKYTGDTLTFKTKCSRGTYIRSLGVDISRKLNNDGHLSFLKRTKIGNVKLEEANSYDDLLNGNVKLLSIKDCVPFKVLNIFDSSILKRVYYGQDIILKNETDERLLICDIDKEIAVYKKIDKNIYHCERGLFDEDFKSRRLKEF